MFLVGDNLGMTPEELRALKSATCTTSVTVEDRWCFSGAKFFVSPNLRPVPQRSTERSEVLSKGLFTMFNGRAE